MLEMIFTDHALERYVKRVDRSVTIDQARKILQNAAQSAAPLREKTRHGEAMWEVESPHIRLVTKYDDGDLICVTILSEKEFLKDEDFEIEYELALARQVEDHRLENYEQICSQNNVVTDLKRYIKKNESLEKDKCLSEKSKLRGILSSRQSALLHAANIVLKSGADATIHIKIAEEYLSLVVAEFGENSKCVSAFRNLLKLLKDTQESNVKYENI